MGIKYQGSPLADTVLSAAQVKLRYESNADTNEFDDAEKTKLTNIEEGARDDLTGAEIKALYQAQSKAYTDAKDTKLGDIEEEAKDDQTGAEIKVLYQAQLKAYTDAKDTKLTGIQAGAKDDQTPAEIKDALHTLSSPNQLDTDHVQEGTNKYFFEAARKAMTGIVDAEQNNAVITFDNSTKILTVTHSSNYTSYVEGVPITHTGDKTKDISGSIAEGWWWFWFNAAGDIQAAQSLPNYAIAAFLAYGYWDATNSEMRGLAEERHGVIMPWKTHYKFHISVGTQHGSGLGATTSVITSPSAPSDDQPSKIWLAGGVLEDEDIGIEIVSAGSPSANFEQILGSDLASAAAKLPIWYRDGAGVWRINANADKLAFAHGGGNTLPFWNEDAGGPNWGLTAAANLDFVVYWVCAATFYSGPVFLIPHTAVFSSLEECQALTVADIDFSDVDFPEITILYRLSFECRTAYVNATHRCVLRDAKDFRGTSVAAAAKVPGFDRAAADAWLPGKTTDDMAIADNFKKSVSKDHTVGSGGQGTGAITSDYVEIATAEAGNDVTLPSAVEGMEIEIDNTASGNDVDVFPASADDVGAGVNSPIILPGGLRGRYKALDNTSWAVSTILGLIRADITLYIATGGSDTTGDGTAGNPWASANRALEYLSNFFASPEITVTIEFADGHYSGLSTIEPKHPFGAQTLITGENTHTKSMTSVESSSGSAGAWSIVLNLDSVADIVPDDLVIISGAANGTKPTFIGGRHEVTNVDVGNSRITIASTHNHATPPSGAVTADVVVLKSVLDFGANDGVLVQKNNVINFAKLGIVSSAIAIHCLSGAHLSAAVVGLGGGSSGAYAAHAGSISLVNCAASDCVVAVHSTRKGCISLSGIVASGSGDGFVAAGGTIWSLSTILATGHANTGFNVNQNALLFANNLFSTGNAYGLFAQKHGYLDAAGRTLSDNTTADTSPAENTVGNEEGYINT